MYPKVDFPKKVTMRWLDKAFAPLKEYLISQYPGKEKRIMGYMSFKENENGQFLYENRITSGQIVFDQAGTLVYCGEFALQYEFAPLYENQIPVVTDYAHPNVFSQELRIFYGTCGGACRRIDRDMELVLSAKARKMLEEEEKGS